MTDTEYENALQYQERFKNYSLKTSLIQGINLNNRCCITNACKWCKDRKMSSCCEIQQKIFQCGVYCYLKLSVLLLLMEQTAAENEQTEDKYGRLHKEMLFNSFNTLRTELLNCLNARSRVLTFRHRASCIQGQAFSYSPENTFYIFNQ